LYSKLDLAIQSIIGAKQKRLSIDFPLFSTLCIDLSGIFAGVFSVRFCAFLWVSAIVVLHASSCGCSGGLSGDNNKA
jgi:hypothetical protein